MTVTNEFRSARDHLVSLQQDWQRAREEFEWPRFDHFNFGFDWFDHVAASDERKDQDALIILEEDGSELRRTFGELSRDSNKVANWLREQGVQRGDRVILMLNNQVELWEAMLACIKLEAVMVPTTTQMGPADLEDRVTRAEAKWAIVGMQDAPKFAPVAGDYSVIYVPGAYTPVDHIESPDAGGRTVLNYNEALSGAENHQMASEPPAN